jgi:hypothetical protein
MAIGALAASTGLHKARGGVASPTSTDEDGPSQPPGVTHGGLVRTLEMGACCARGTLTRRTARRRCRSDGVRKPAPARVTSADSERARRS